MEQTVGGGDVVVAPLNKYMGVSDKLWFVWKK